MRPGAVPICVLGAVLAAAALPARACEPGSTLTVNGTITAVSQYDDSWELQTEIFGIKDCDIWHVRGPGRLPDDCGADHEFTANGTVDLGGFNDFLAAMAGKNVMGLAVTKIECR